MLPAAARVGVSAVPLSFLLLPARARATARPSGRSRWWSSAARSAAGGGGGVHLPRVPHAEIGRWLRHPAFAILLPVPLFVLGHGYDLLGQIGVGLFAVAAGWLTWRTGGLEAAIALHVVNNLSGSCCRSLRRRSDRE
jgi:hypothetical protein